VGTKKGPGSEPSRNLSKTGFGYIGGGTLRSRNSISFQYFRYYIMSLWVVLDLFADVSCITDSGESVFDLAMVSEVRLDWSDDLFFLTCVMCSLRGAMCCV